MSDSEKATCFRLTAAEREQLEQRNAEYRCTIPVEREITDIISLSESDTQRFRIAWEFMTATEFREHYPELQRYTAAQIGKALSACKIETKSVRKNGVTPRKSYFLPKRQFF